MRDDSIQVLLQKIKKGEIRALSRAITLLESNHPRDSERAHRLLTALPKKGSSFRIGITGVPGAGKSTLIENFGLRWIKHFPRLAVLTVDPSSPRGGGSVLGDKTRMTRLSRAPGTFIRPSPQGDFEGGIAHRTRESLLLCEAAGFQTVIIETVGIGQTEIRAARMTDMLLLVLTPDPGDELQTVKKGVLEMADCLVINKSDRDSLQAQKTADRLKLALGSRAERDIPILLCSADRGVGLPELENCVLSFRQRFFQEGNDSGFQVRRRTQNRDWFRDLLGDRLLGTILNQPEVIALKKQAEEDILAGDRDPMEAVDEILTAFLKRKGDATVVEDGE